MGSRYNGREQRTTISGREAENSAYSCDRCGFGVDQGENDSVADKLGIYSEQRRWRLI